MQGNKIREFVFYTPVLQTFLHFYMLTDTTAIYIMKNILSPTGRPFNLKTHPNDMVTSQSCWTCLKKKFSRPNGTK